MLSRMRKTYDAAFKAKVAFEAAKGEKTIAQIASEFSVHPKRVRRVMGLEAIYPKPRLSANGPITRLIPIL